MIYTQEEMALWGMSLTHPHSLPPIIVTKDGYVVEGYHRVQLAILRGERVASVVIDATVQMLDPNSLKVWRDTGE